MQDGFLTISVVDSTTNAPIQDVTINIYGQNADGSTSSAIYQNLKTNESGQIVNIPLSAPDVYYSLDPTSTTKPYAEYIVEAIKDGYETIIIDGTQLLPIVIARQPIPMTPKQRSRRSYRRQNKIIYRIEPHTLWGYYPPKIPEDSLKPIPAPTGFVVLDNPVVPEFIVVHDGLPSDSSAENYWVPFKTYIKNVASSEIYATWPRATIEANVLAIMSFTLNRVYTEWYRNKGYDFTITSSTAYDQKWIYGRNIFQSIDEVVDEIFDQYLSRPDVRQPILTQYCDGKRVTCPNWLSQWGSCNLGEQGFGTLEIIRNYYGDDMYINTAEQISGIPASWPGYDLTIGASGQKVMQMQEQLDTIARVYTAIPRVSADGVFGEGTQASVRAFQKIFDLPQTGVVDFSTWYKISQIYVGITRIAEGIPRG